jgi:hypothetical protein
MEAAVFWLAENMVDNIKAELPARKYVVQFVISIYEICRV